MNVQVQLQNGTTTPLSLAYMPGTAMVTDNLGNRYSAAMVGTTDVSVSGMGVAGGQASAGFVLLPGQVRGASFRLLRAATAKGAIGTAFTVSFAVAELATSTGQTRMARQDRVS